jgi:predicted permease
MGNFALLIVCLLAGVLLRRLPGFPAQAHLGLNAYIFYISLPALTLRYIPKLQYHWEILFPALMPWLVFLLAALLFVLLGKALHWDKRLVGCVVLTSGLGNTSFVGFPMLELFYGSEGIRYGLIADQAGTFLVVSTLGIATAVYSDSGRPRKRDLLQKLLSFPPFPAFILALLLTGFTFPEWLDTMLEKLGATLSPLALVSIGLQLSWSKEAFNDWPALGIGLLYKLLAAPLLIYGLYANVFGLSGLVLKVSVVEAAMGPMVTGVLLATQYKLKPALASLFAAIGIPLSLVTLWFWYWLLA